MGPHVGNVEVVSQLLQMTLAHNWSGSLHLEYAPPLCYDERMATTSERPLRKDAERNRQRVLDAARELFAERGLGVSLDDIARHAGVGVGTVYRRFPDKEQLIDALFEERIGEMLSAAGESLEMPDPWLALVRFLERALE